MADCFWHKPLEELSFAEWEQLCDGCGRCCLKKLTAKDSDETLYTRVVCRCFDEETSQCKHYIKRQTIVPDCLVVSKMDRSALKWMPTTCAYRLRNEGKPLFDWHPLIAGSTAAMDNLGISIKGKVLSEEYVHDEGLEEHIIRWVTAKDE
jgi:uncharacterized cysteine cluster protein YcgN (CxxCxxCC family)